MVNFRLSCSIMAAILFLFVWGVTGAAEVLSTSTPSTPSLVKESTANETKVFLKPFVRVPIYSFELSPDDTRDKSVAYEANVSSELGFALELSGLSLSYAQSLDDNDDDGKNKGNTSYTDYQFSYFHGMFGFGTAYEDYTGFYIDEPGQQDVYEHRADLRKQTLALDFFFIPFAADIDQEFSRNPTDSTPTEHGSLFKRYMTLGNNVFWSPIAQGFYERTTLSANDSIIPQRSLVLFGEDSDLSSAKMQSIGLAPGAAMFFKSRAHHCTLLLTTGSYLQQQKLTRGDQDEERRAYGSRTSLMFDYRFAMNELWTTGLNMMVHTNESKFKGYQFEEDHGEITVSIARAVNRPTWMR